MTPEVGDLVGHFHVGYDESNSIFEAYVRVSTSAQDDVMLTAASRSLETLLKKCRQQGLVNFDGLTPEAVNKIHRWLVVERPAYDYVAGIWGGSSLSDRGPIGFRPPQ